MIRRVAAPTTAKSLQDHLVRCHGANPLMTIATSPRTLVQTHEREHEQFKHFRLAHSHDG